MDFDGIQDRYDADTNNNGIKNIYELDTKKAISFIESISNEQYMVTNSNDTWSKIKYLFGALGSYRLISQTYYEQNLPIEPVLKEYYSTKNISNNYNSKFVYPEVLYQYLTEYGQTDTFQKGKYIGEIFFILQETEVVNMGIVLNEDSFGTVLLNDTILRSHTMTDILEEYDNAEIKVVSIY